MKSCRIATNGEQQKFPQGLKSAAFLAPSLLRQAQCPKTIFWMRIAPMSYSRETGYFYATGVVFPGVAATHGRSLHVAGLGRHCSRFA